MNNSVRFTLLSLFAAAGLGVAICVALSLGEPRPADEQPNLGLGARPTRAHLAAVVKQHPLNFYPDVLRVQPALRMQVASLNTEPAPQSALSYSDSDEPPHSEPPVPETQSDAITSRLPEVQQPTHAHLPADDLANPAPEVPRLNLVGDNGDDNGIGQLVAALQERAPGADSSSSNPPNVPPPPAPAATSTVADQNRPRMPLVQASGEGDDRLSLTIPGEDVRRVLQLLSAQGGLNILASKNVQGTVSATLKNVDIETALDAILKSTGFLWWRDGEVIHVGTPQDFAAMQQAGDRISTRLYRPNYVRSADLQALITPLLTPSIGTISVNTAAQVGIAPDSNTAGGDAYAGQEALLVRDYENVLAQVDQIVEQVDRRPTQVAIEAMILSVTLDDKNEFGVDFELLRDNSNVRLVSGNPLGSLAQMDFSNGGLKVGFLDSSTALFLNALETIGDTNVIATPRVMCLNKHRAEILIGEQLGYVSTTQTETSTTQSVEFLEVGTQLRLRPFISSDGMVRMEVHPELSTGNVRLEGNFTLPDKKVTQVTTNIMVRDGCTVIIGGLLRDSLSSTATQIPLLGSLPVIGPVFRKNTETTQRQEILVLITPRIVYEPAACCAGDKGAMEFHHQHAVYADQMIPLGRRYLGRKHFRLAQVAWDQGRAREALKQVNLAIHFDPMNRAAIDLRSDIWEGSPAGDHTLASPAGSPGAGLSGAGTLEGGAMPPWILDRMEGAPRTDHPLDPGRPASRSNIQRPGLQR